MMCIRCHRLSPGYKTCAACRRHQAAARVFVASAYEGLLKEIIKRFKYERSASAAQSLTPVLRDVLPEERWDTIVPVPSTTSRQRQRGYNPAALLARGLSAQMHLPYQPLLHRLGQTRQVGATRATRLTQLEGSFYTTASCSGARILLVDDVVTTGATIASCARTLRSAGAVSVDAVVLARHTT